MGDWVLFLLFLYAACVAVAGLVLFLIATASSGRGPARPRFIHRSLVGGLMGMVVVCGAVPLAAAPSVVFWPVFLALLTVLGVLLRRWWRRTGRAGFAALRAELREDGL